MMPGVYEYSSYKNKCPSNEPQTQNGDFLVNISYGFDYISVIYGDHTSKQNCISSVCRKITVCPLRTPFTILFVVYFKTP
jgi:hypothetical protein